MSTRYAPLFLLFVVGCAQRDAAPRVVDPVAVPGAGSAWWAEVSSRLDDAGHAFVADGDIFLVSAREQGIQARFDGAGAELRFGSGVVQVQVTGVGREEGADPALAAAPALGACVPGLVAPDGRCVQRLEYAGAGLTAWWASRPDGLEQGWTVETPPPGAGPLSIDVDLIGATSALDGDTVWVTADDGSTLLVSGLRAWDADGVPLDAWMEPSGDGFRVRVDDAEARFPITVDPVYTTAAWTKDGTALAGQFGHTVKGAGDLDKDGYADVLVGADGTTLCQVFVYYGSSAGLPLLAATTLVGPASSGFGQALDAAGDVNNDTYPDVVVGAPLHNSSRGAVYVYLGGASGLSTTPVATLVGAAASYSFGAAVAGAGDVQKDGYGDILVGAPGASLGAGQAYLYRGTSSGISSTAQSTFTGDAPASGYQPPAFGSMLSAAGDVNNDTYADVLIGAPGYSSGTGRDQGRAYVYRGSATGLVSGTRTTLSPGAQLSSFGATSARMGDTNGDGYADLIIGSPSYNSGVGRVYLYRGSSSGVSTTPTTTWTGTASAPLGAALANAGDLNGDGWADALFGAPSAASGAGVVYVVRGTGTGMSSTLSETVSAPVTATGFGTAVAGAGDVDGNGFPDAVLTTRVSGTARVFVFDGSASGLTGTTWRELPAITASALGSAVAAAGDMDDDGYADVVVGAPSYASDLGAVYLFRGSSTGLRTVATSAVYGREPGELFGGSVAAAGDVNGDGHADVVVGSYGYDDYTGRAALILGQAGGLASTPATTVTGEDPGDGFALSIDGAGDVDGDGYADMIVGAASVSSGRGRVYLYRGQAAGLETTPAWTYTGAAANDFAGLSVRGVGDVDQDGYADVLLGAPGVSSSTGAALLFRGSTTGLAASPDTTLAGEVSGTSFGHTVAGAGDVDGDGYDDVAVTATGYDGSRGRVYVYRGSATGLLSTVASRVTGETASLRLGLALDGAGDVNQDGRDDLVLGSNVVGGGAGRAWVYVALPDGFTDTARTVLPGAGGAFGVSVAGAGDVNGDGFADVVIGASGTGSGAGSAYAFHGYQVDADGDGSFDGTDCDDNNAAAHPGATEVCDPANVDEDCDRLSDDADTSLSLASRLTWYLDADADGYAGSATTVLQCEAPAGYLATATDCNDAVAAIHPGATEVCDPSDTDEDCDGTADNADSSASAATRTTFYRDVDADGFGGSTTGAFCDLPAGYTATLTDCNDASAAINPSAAEVCDAGNVDDDCDGAADDADPGVSPAGYTIFFVDADLDTYGGPNTIAKCDRPAGAATTSTDCNDSVNGIHPGAMEVCDVANVDEDCDTLADNADPSASDLTKNTFHADADGDAYGSMTVTVRACDLPEGFVADATDCDDGNAAISPFSQEVCDPANTDEDCDGLADNADTSASVATKTTFWADHDGDGYGGSTSAKFCDPTAGFVLDHTDCNDATASISPGATEVCDPLNLDEDCDALADDADSTVSEVSKITFYLDVDRDGYGGGGTTRACERPAGATAVSDDCNDAVAAIHPGATEVCDAGDVDEDCDGMSDDADPSVSSITRGTFYADLDGDGYGSTTPTYACDLPSGSSATSDDCNDGVASVHPGAAEVCDAANTDEDCDAKADDADTSVYDPSRTTFYVDADLDGFGGSTTVRACDAASGRVATSTDCDDAIAAIHPGAIEVCDPANTDEDCDGAADDADASVLAATRATFYPDADGDGYGTGAAVSTCDAAPGYGPLSGDCDDAAAAVHPGATEVCDASDVDEDCDALADDLDPSTSLASKASYWVDADVDGYGGGAPVLACAAQPGRVTTGGDCNDAAAGIHPGAAEVCDAGDVDEDCDGAADDADPSVAAGSRTTYHPDRDFDGYGDRNESMSRCDPLAGQFLDGTDCDDAVATTHPGATEVVGDGVDADCDTTELCYADDDRDGARTDRTVASADLDCADAGEALNGAPDDCDDRDPATRPGAPELLADGVDEDCDGEELCLLDVDDDGYRAGNSTVRSSDADCADPFEALATDPSGDCDDGSALFHPNAPETDCADPSDYNCDGATGFADNDADGWPACEECDDQDGAIRPDADEIAGDGVDSDCDEVDLCYLDGDGDGYRPDGEATFLGSTVACNALGEAPASAPAGDCDDGSASTHPGTFDVIGDGVDGDCNGRETCWSDADGDGARPNATDTVASFDLDCTDVGEASATAITTDCNDRDAGIRPGRTERIGDEIDSDCDGAELCFVDADGDDYRPAGVVTVPSADADCADAGEAPATALAGDCDDRSALFHPGAAESDCADPNDYNCDGSVAFTDADRDGWAACAECDDTRAAVYPGATERPGDALDSDCDGLETCFVDADGDGGRPDATSTVPSTNLACDGSGEATATAPPTDCDDADPDVGPYAIEIEDDGVDQDCDGEELCYADADEDGYRRDDLTFVASADADCADPGEATLATASGDCDDGDALFHPGAAEVTCGDGADYNCDGSTGYADHDLDGFAACDECDDSVRDVNPGADELCNGVDDNCDGVIDEATARDATVWFADGDSDGFTSTIDSRRSCVAPEGFAAESDRADCDDADASVHPDAAEVADDGVDQDCVGGDLVTDLPDDTDSAPSDDTDTGTPTEPPGCTCDQGVRPPMGLIGLAVGLVLVRRRRSATRWDTGGTVT